MSAKIGDCPTCLGYGSLHGTGTECLDCNGYGTIDSMPRTQLVEMVGELKEQMRDNHQRAEEIIEAREKEIERLRFENAEPSCDEAQSTNNSNQY